MILDILYFFLLFIALYARYKNICECQEAGEMFSDFLQILIIGLGGWYYLGATQLFKLGLVILVSIIVKNGTFYFSKNKKEPKQKDEDCEDCNPYQRY